MLIILLLILVKMLLMLSYQTYHQLHSLPSNVDQKVSLLIKPLLASMISDRLLCVDNNTTQSIRAGLPPFEWVGRADRLACPSKL